MRLRLGGTRAWWRMTCGRTEGEMSRGSRARGGSAKGMLESAAVAAGEACTTWYTVRIRGCIDKGRHKPDILEAAA